MVHPIAVDGSLVFTVLIIGITLPADRDIVRRRDVSKFVGGLSGHNLAAKDGMMVTFPGGLSVPEGQCRFYVYADFSCSAA